MTQDLSHLTAMTRNSPSAPMYWMNKEGLLKGKMLDYGCGKGYDADTFGMAKYDPFFFNGGDFSENEFDTITCNYVLNTISLVVERTMVILRMQRLLKPDGNLYIAVRADHRSLQGYTRRGTWQGSIVLEHKLINTVSGGYRLYHLRKD